MKNEEFYKNGAQMAYNERGGGVGTLARWRYYAIMSGILCQDMGIKNNPRAARGRRGLLLFMVYCYLVTGALPSQSPTVVVSRSMIVP